MEPLAEILVLPDIEKKINSYRLKIKNCIKFEEKLSQYSKVFEKYKRFPVLTNTKFKGKI